MAFRVELVGVAQQLFLGRFGHVGARRQRQLLGGNLLGRQPCASVAFAHPGQPVHAVRAKQFGTQIAVQQVGVRAVAVNAWGFCHEDAHIVQQGGLHQEGAVHAQLGVARSNAQGTPHHLPAVVQQQAAQRVVVWVVSQYDVKSVHTFWPQRYNFPLGYALPIPILITFANR